MGRTICLQQAGYERWGQLSEAAHTGRRPEINRQIEGRANWGCDFEEALYELARVSANF